MMPPTPFCSAGLTLRRRTLVVATCEVVYTRFSPTAELSHSSCGKVEIVRDAY